MAALNITAPVHWTQEFVTSPVVTLVVGGHYPVWIGEPVKLWAHEAHLVKIPFFKAALAERSHAQEKVFHLETEHPSYMQFVLTYLHSENVMTAFDQANLRDFNEGYVTWTLADLWLLAQSLQLSDLQDQLMSAMATFCKNENEFFGEGGLLRIYGRTQQGSALRKLAICLEWSHNGNLRQGSIQDSFLTKEILEDLLEEALMRIDRANENLLQEVVHGESVEVERFFVLGEEGQEA